MVGVLSTGDELVEPGEQHLAPGQIRDANRLMLASAASTSGCVVVDLGIARDTVEDVRAETKALPAPVWPCMTTAGALWHSELSWTAHDIVAHSAGVEETLHHSQQSFVVLSCSCWCNADRGKVPACREQGSGCPPHLR